LALTDHDTIGGVAEARKAAEAHGIELLPGVEFSVRARRGQTHILGYGIDIDNQQLARTLEDLRLARTGRGVKIVERLAQLGIELPPTALEPGRPGGSPGRPHVARALVEIGAAESIQDAFERFLSVGRPAFVPRYTVTASEAIDAIRAAAGVAVLAHPLSVYGLDETLPRLRDAGLEGLEAHYAEYDPAQRAAFLKLADAHGLLVTGGSDYHGAPEARGRVLGSVSLPQHVLRALLDRLK
jgi:hypothetical protein